MRLGDVPERSLRPAPIPVMSGALPGHALDPDELDRRFGQAASSQYTRERLSCSVVDLMGRVARGAHPSARSAYLASPGEVSASLAAGYAALQGIEPGVCRGLLTGLPPGPAGARLVAG